MNIIYAIDSSYREPFKQNVDLLNCGAQLFTQKNNDHYCYGE